MEANRLNIAREKSPTVILTNILYEFTDDMEVGDKGQLEATFEIVKQTIEPDENDNEVIKHTLRVIKAEVYAPKGLRV